MRASGSMWRSSQMPMSPGVIRALGGDGGRFHEEESCSAHCAAAEMNQMPIVGHSVDGRILAHGRNHDAIFESYSANRERVKEVDGGHAGSIVADSEYISKFQYP